MKEFKKENLLALFYEIMGWLVLSKSMPKKIEFRNEGDFIVATVYYFPKENSGEPKKIAKEESELTLAEKAMKLRYERTYEKIIGGE